MPRVVGIYPCVVAFYTVGEEFDWMANTFRGRPVLIDGVIWPTTEHYFQAMKFPGQSPAQQAYRQAIFNYNDSFAKFPGFAKNAAQGLPFDAADWDGEEGMLNGRSHEVMRKAVRAKLTAHPDLKAQLEALPADAIIVEATLLDKKWADGDNGFGTNHLGIIYMEMLRELKNKWSVQLAQDSANRDYLAFAAYRKEQFGGVSLYHPRFNQQAQAQGQQTQTQTQAATATSTAAASTAATTTTTATTASAATTTTTTTLTPGKTNPEKDFDDAIKAVDPGTDPERIKFVKALKDLKKASFDEKRTPQELSVLGKSALTLARQVGSNTAKLSHVEQFEKDTAPYKKNWNWKMILGAVVGAALGIILGAMLGALAGPAGALLALAAGVQGAVIGATLCGGALSIASAGCAFWQLRKNDPVAQAAVSARKLLVPK